MFTSKTIPKKFTLGAVNWTVEEVDSLVNAMGATFLAESKVQILKGLKQDVKEQTFYHELVHCILYALGKMQHDEEFVDSFAVMLHQYMKTHK